MILNILHRPERSDRRELFELEQAFAHDNGIRTTILMTAESLSDPSQVALAREHAAAYGDEIGLSFHGLGHASIVDLVGYAQEALWLYSLAHKRIVLEFLIGTFRDRFGFTPTGVASYHFDSSTMRILREVAPEVRAAVAGCFEEGVRVFHGCNHSWYLFNEGMPWGPWYPSKSHTLRPAADEDDWCGVVAVPHLMRDMVLSYEGRNDFWASHPPNVMRGMGYEGEDCPYDRNLIDMFRRQESLNDGYSYYNSFVSTAWLAEHHAIDDSPLVAQSLYRQQLEYLGELKRRGEVEDMTLTGFADWYRSNRPIGGSEAYFAKEMLYGSGKHYFWFVDRDQRVLLDATQGGSIGDLRPYAGRVAVETGPESPSLCYGSYPYLIQSQHRTGMPNHSQDGSRSTALVTVNGVVYDLGEFPTRIESVDRAADVTRVEFTAVEVGGEGGALLKTTVEFLPAGSTVIRRTLLRAPGGSVAVTERVKMAPGITEYPQSLAGVTFGVGGGSAGATVSDGQRMEYRYDGRRVELDPVSGASAWACFPSLSTRAELAAGDDALWSARAEEGNLFSPYVTLCLSTTIAVGKESAACVRLSRM